MRPEILVQLEQLRVDQAVIIRGLGQRLEMIVKHGLDIAEAERRIPRDALRRVARKVDSNRVFDELQE